MSRQIVVALDGSPGSLSALRAGAALARLIDAELIGVFVVEEALERLAGLPVFREVRPHTGEVALLDADRLKADLDALEAVARRALRRESALMGLVSRFLVKRGVAAEEILSVAEGADAIAIARVRSRPGRRAAFGSTSSGVMRSQACSLILVEPGDVMRGPILVYYEGGARSRRALALALQMGELWDHQVTLMLPPSEPAPMAARLGQRNVSTVRLRSGARDLPDVLPRSGGCLIVAADSPAAEESLLARVMGELSCSVIVVADDDSEESADEIGSGTDDELESRGQSGDEPLEGATASSDSGG